MRARQAWFPLVVMVCAAVFGSAAGAQIQPCVSAGVMMGGGMVGMGAARPNIPFSGVVKSSFEQKLADGNAIHRVTLTHQARDSAGRTMTEMAEGCVLGADGQKHERLSVSVNDPVARTSLNWQVGADDQPKVVHVFHQPELKAANSSQSAKRPEPTAAELEQQQKMMKAAQAQALLTRKETRTEDLGVKDFNGVSAQGSRTTRTIPAGEEGNDQPLVVVNETWRSKELGVVVMSIRDDPRTGRNVTEFEELTRGEPDPGLFAPPAGYTVQEQPQNGILSGMVMSGVSY
jgi:hypothetical protein